MEFKDYYQVLGVSRDANADQIKQAFRRLARKFHPDVSKEPDAAARMAAINEANAVLSDTERRAAYDAVGQGRRQGEAFTPPPDWDAGYEFSGRGPDRADAGEFSDFFAELFGRMGAGRARPQSARGGRGTQEDGAAAFRGDDHHAKLLLDLEDAWSGTTKQVTLRGAQLDAGGRPVLRERTLEVAIPAGVRAGRLIRLAGQGGAGTGGAPAGDLLLEVHLRPHARFGLDGANLLAELPVAPWEAALGAVVPVMLPDGSSMKVRVPAGAQGGRSLNVRGKGLPGKPPGDLELVVRIVLPNADDPRARRLYETMARELPDFDARAAAHARQPAGEQR